ncbi:hypothetical protein WMF30_40095 [Sorangium sp. So ce134]
MAKYVFRRIGPSAADLQLNYLLPGVTVVVGPVVPEQTIEFDLSDDAALNDLQQAVSREWEYVGPAPAEPEGG